MGKIKSSKSQEAFIWLLRAFAPLSCVYAVYRIIVCIIINLLPSSSIPPILYRLHLPLALEVFIYAEVAFYLYIIWRSRVLSQRRVPPPLSLEERELILSRLVAHTDDMKEMISGWFMDVSFEDLRKEDLEKFVSWMLFSKTVDEIEDGPERESVQRGIATIERAAGHALPSRSIGEPEHFVMRHTIDNLKYKHRPLIVYLATHVLVNAVLGNAVMYSLGFRRYHAAHITYWRRPGQAQASGPPVVFVHGIGLGLIMYLDFLRHLSKNIASDVFLVELPHASLKVCEFVPSSSQAVKSILTMLARHGHKRAVFSSHSLGSVYVSWMCRYAPHAVAASVFVEPIVFMLFLKTVTRNFLYQDYGGSIGYIIRSELFLNHALRRHFWWHENVLWLEDVDHSCHVFLCHQDEVVPSKNVVSYIEKHDRGHHVTIEMMDEDYHGAWLLNGATRQRIAETVERVWNAVPYSPLDKVSSSTSTSNALLDVEECEIHFTAEGPPAVSMEIPMSEQHLASSSSDRLGGATHARRRSKHLGIGDGDLIEVLLDENTGSVGAF